MLINYISENKKESAQRMDGVNDLIVNIKTDDIELAKEKQEEILEHIAKQPVFWSDYRGIHWCYDMPLGLSTGKEYNEWLSKPHSHNHPWVESLHWNNGNDEVTCGIYFHKEEEEC